MADPKLILDADAAKVRQEIERNVEQPLRDAGAAGKEAGASIEAGLSGALDKTTAAFARLDAKIENGELRGLPRAITASTLAVEQLEAEIAQLRARGADVTSLEQAAARFRDRLQQATTQAGKMADKMEEVNRTVKASAAAADFGFGKLGTAMGSTLELMSKMYFAANLVGQGIQGIAKALDSIQAATGTATEGSRQMNSELAAVGQSIASLDVVGLAENLGKFAGSAIDGADATNALADATRNWNDAMAGAVGKLAGVLAAQKRFVSGLADQRKANRDNAEAIVREAENEIAARGKVQDATREWLKETLDAYERIGDEPPEKLQKLADSLGIVSSAQEKAGESAKRTAEEQEKAADAAEANAQREADAAAKAAEAATKAAQAKIDALKREEEAAQEKAKTAQEAYEAEVARNTTDAPGAAEKELNELRSKNTLTVEEANRLAELEQVTGSLASAMDKRRKATEALAREDEAFAKVQEERAKVEEAESRRIDAEIEAYREREKALADQAEADTTWQDVELRTIDAMEKAGAITKEEADARRTSAQAAKDQALAGDQVNESLAETAETAPEAAEALGKFGEESKKAGEGLDALATAAERSRDAIKEIVRELLPEMIQLAAQVRLGGSTDGAGE